jgi:hypothetical protein
MQNADLKKQNEQMQRRLARLESLLESQVAVDAVGTVAEASLHPEGNKK